MGRLLMRSARANYCCCCYTCIGMSVRSGRGHQTVRAIRSTVKAHGQGSNGAAKQTLVSIFFFFDDDCGSPSCS